MRDFESIEDGVGSRIHTSIESTGTSTNSDVNGHDIANDISMNHHHQFSSNHQLNALGNFMGISNLHAISNLEHNEVLEKLKMQVRDIKVGHMDQEYAVAHTTAFGQNMVPTPINTAFALPPTTIASFTQASHNLALQAGNNLNLHLDPNSCLLAPSLSNSRHTNFSFASPPSLSTKDVNPTSNSSTSSETSNSSHQNGWSFEEQYKQVRQEKKTKLTTAEIQKRYRAKLQLGEKRYAEYKQKARERSFKQPKRGEMSLRPKVM